MGITSTVVNRNAIRKYLQPSTAVKIVHLITGILIVPERSEKETAKNDRLQQLINYGVPLLCASASAAVSSALGLIGPEGAAIGGMVGKGVEIWLSKVGQEISERHLSTREKVRVGAVLVFAAEGIRRRLESGEPLREDGFFDEKQSGRSDAAEVAEHVLLKVQREPEEKKIRYMGYLYESIPFEPQISVHMAHQLIKAAEQLTYRQLCILRLCAVKDMFGLRNNNYRERYKIEKDLYEVLSECADLHNKEYIHSGLDTITFERNALSRLRSIIPSNMTFQAIGNYLYNLMKLSQIPDEDIAKIAEELK